MRIHKNGVLRRVPVNPREGDRVSILFRIVAELAFESLSLVAKFSDLVHLQISIKNQICIISSFVLDFYHCKIWTRTGAGFDFFQDGTFIFSYSLSLSEPDPILNWWLQTAVLGCLAVVVVVVGYFNHPGLRKMIRNHIRLLPNQKKCRMINSSKVGGQLQGQKSRQRGPTTVSKSISEGRKKRRILTLHNVQ